MQQRLRSALCVLPLLLAGVAGQAAADDVYQWKDANGVTHYSQTPPKDAKYVQRVITHSGASRTQAAAEATTPAPTGPTPRPAVAKAGAESAQCKTARANVTALQGKTDVTVDTNGDGKPDKVLDAAGRASQLQLAQAGVAAYCN